MKWPEWRTGKEGDCAVAAVRDSGFTRVRICNGTGVGGRRSLSILRLDALRPIRRIVLGIGVRSMTEVGRLVFPVGGCERRCRCRQFGMEPE